MSGMSVYLLLTMEADAKSTEYFWCNYLY